MTSTTTPVVLGIGLSEILIILGVTAVVLLIGAWLAWRRMDASARALMKRIEKLAPRSKLRLAANLVKDDRIPLSLRAVPVLLILYLVLPFDIIPDFIPILGQVDDVIAIIVAAGLLLRYVPRSVIEEHIAALEADTAERIEAGRPTT